MHFLQEFKKFIRRGSVIDMAVGIVIGASFTKIVDTFVNHIFMPLIGFIIGGNDFGDLQITLQKPIGNAPAVTINYGLFLNTLMNFIIVSAAIFVLIKIMHRFYFQSSILSKHPCPECKMEIPTGARRCGYCTSILSE